MSNQRHSTICTVRSAAPDDARAWLEMRCALWPEGDADHHAREIAQFFEGSLRMPLEVLLALEPGGAAIGVVELSIRPYAEGCETENVAYLEGWYVVPAWRRRGVGRTLMRHAESWARAQGCTEFASDALLDNLVSKDAHEALGFTEIEKIRCFAKRLRPDG